MDSKQHIKEILDSVTDWHTYYLKNNKFSFSIFNTEYTCKISATDLNNYYSITYRVFDNKYTFESFAHNMFIFELFNYDVENKKMHIKPNIDYTYPEKIIDMIVKIKRLFETHEIDAEKSIEETITCNDDFIEQLKLEYKNTGKLKPFWKKEND